MSRNPPHLRLHHYLQHIATTSIGLSSLRSRIVLTLFAFAFTVLIVRILWLQCASTDFLQKQGDARYTRTLILPATRGKMLDRQGDVLAISVPVRAIWAIPGNVMTHASASQLQQLAHLLNLSTEALQRKLNTPRNFVYLKRQVELPTVDKILALKINGIHILPEYKRFYPEGNVISHIVGFTNIEDIGQDGMELSQNRKLVGTLGSRHVIQDRLGRVVENIKTVKIPQDGQDIVLSINSKIQYIAFSALKDAVKKSQASAGSIVVLDVRTGEVLAMANMPTYDPNNRAKLVGPQLRNRAITDIFEPGSSLKPFSVALALDKERITPDTLFDIGPKMTIGSATIGDAHITQGALTVSQIIQKSSNIGTAKISLEYLKPDEIWKMFTAIGLGQAPTTEFPGAALGRIRPHESWRPIEQATMSYGHGISVSLLQLAKAYLIFSRNGDIIPLTFQKVDPTAPLPQGQQVISKKTAKTMRTMLESVTAPGGSAVKAQVPGYRVAGKTGTAYKIENGKYVRKYNADFVGFAPVSNPRIIVAVLIDNPHASMRYGSQVAAPVFANVVQNVLRALHVPPDANNEHIVISAYTPFDEGM